MITHFDIDIYCYRVHVLHDITDEEFIKYFKDTFRCPVDRDSAISASVWQMENTSGRRESIIDFRRKIKRDMFSLNTIVHECLHVTFDVMEYIGMTLDYEKNHEAYCYLMAHITEKVYEILYKNKGE
jgi:hypothetical protein